MPRTRATPAEHPAPQALRGGCPLPGGLWVAGLRPGFLCAGFPWRPDGPRVTSVSVTRHARQLATPASWQSERVMVADAKLLIATNATPTACLLPRSCEGRAAIRQTRHALSAGAIGQDMMSVCLCSAQKRTQHAAPSPKARAPRRGRASLATFRHWRLRHTQAARCRKQHHTRRSTRRASRVQLPPLAQSPQIVRFRTRTSATRPTRLRRRRRCRVRAVAALRHRCCVTVAPPAVRVIACAQRRRCRHLRLRPTHRTA